MKTAPLGWLGIVRLGLVQSALGAIVCLTTSTLNRVMVVEAAMPAMLPAALVAWHYAIQLLRPRWGHGSDLGHRRTPWIIGGMGVLALGAIVAADATVMMAHSPILGTVMGLAAFSMIGGGVGAAGTSLLALLASRVVVERRPAAASITWIMMVVGIVVTAGVGGALLQPYSEQRLAMVASGVAGVAFLVTLLAVWRIEPEQAAATASAAAPAVAAPALVAPATAPARPFGEVLKEVWADALARQFTIFVFVSMLAYSAQELIIEPFAGLVFGMSPGQSTQLSGVLHGGVLLGIVLVGALGARLGGQRSLWMRRWTIVGCVGSAVALGAMAAASLLGPAWPLKPTVFMLGFANGVFAVSAIGSMMGLAGAGREGGGREGVRMGVWGAAQAGGFAIGGFLGAAGVDLMRHLLSDPAHAFLVVFAMEALAFLGAAGLASRMDSPPRPTTAPRRPQDQLAGEQIEFGGAR